MPDELIATDLLRIARDPSSGRLVRRNTLAVGLRAALFADLALAGQIVDYAGAPYATGAASSTHRFLDQIRDAVAARPGVSWPRWFRYVHGDRIALVNELVDDELWTPVGRNRYIDVDAASMLDRARRLTAVATLRAPPADAPDAILAMLLVVCGATAVPQTLGRPPARPSPRPKAMRNELRPLLDAVGPPDDAVRIAVQHAVGTGATVVRKVRRGRMVA
jgi:Golgi phosphoprotein 3 (GPP34)